jgi:FkbM family methyltransferase
MPKTEIFTLSNLQEASGGELFSDEELRRLEADPSQLPKFAKIALSRLRADERRKQWAGLFGQPIMFEHSCGVSFWLRLGDGVAHSIIRSATAPEDRATRFLLSKLTKGGTFLDVGANAGWFTLRAADHYRKLGGGRVIAFEPQVRLHGDIVKSVRQNKLDDLVEVHNVALGDRTGDFWMVDGGMNSGGSYISWSKPRHPGDSASMRLFDDMFPRLERVDCVKLDIEGSEPLFFKGAAKFIAEHKPVIYSEVGSRKLGLVANSDGADYVRMVEGLGYRTLTLLSDSSVAPLGKNALAERADGILNVVFDPIR